MRYRRTTIPLSMLLLSAAVQHACADKVSLVNGRLIEGKVSFDAKEGLVVLPKNLPSQRVELSDLLSLSVETRDLKPPRRQVTLVTGGRISGDDILAVNDREVRLKRPDGSLVNFNTSLVSRIDYRPADDGVATPESFVGVQLAAGDLAEGEIISVDQKEAKISSVLFGIQSFDVQKSVRAVQFRAAGVSSARYIVRTIDGSEWHATKLSINNGRLTIESDAAGRAEVGGESVVSIELGPGAAEPLAGGQSIALRPGDRREFSLGGKYRAALLTVSIPRRYVPNRPARFVASIDGKDVARTEPLTSIDGPVLLTFTVRGGQSMSVRLEADGPARIGVAGMIDDIKMVRAD